MEIDLQILLGKLPSICSLFLLYINLHYVEVEKDDKENIQSREISITYLVLLISDNNKIKDKLCIYSLQISCVCFANIHL